eukprot:593674-Rhodomonas_salina.1
MVVAADLGRRSTSAMNTYLHCRARYAVSMQHTAAACSNNLQWQLTIVSYNSVIASCSSILQ